MCFIVRSQQLFLLGDVSMSKRAGYDDNGFYTDPPPTEEWPISADGDLVNASPVSAEPREALDVNAAILGKLALGE
ncbi:hypothetical protein KW786_03850 [Candidatus Parcubacteria bacterium]|nr:hypothetical protein [Candidatus Parcubacteria bacterium]